MMQSCILIWYVILNVLISVMGCLDAVFRRGVFCILQKPGSPLWTIGGGQFVYRQLSYLDNLCTHGKLQRDVTVRSELANTSASLPFPGQLIFILLLLIKK